VSAASETLRRAASMTGEVARILAASAFVENLDHRREILDASGKLLEQVRALISGNVVPGDGSLRVVVLVRQVQETQDTLARECEAALRIRSHIF
jgi:hypothetical protein